MPNNTDIKQKKDIELAMRHWAAEITKMCASRFGEHKVGHMLILFPFSRDTSISWISDATSGSVIQMLRELADHIESPNTKIIKAH